eukprot:g24497.t1
MIQTYEDELLACFGPVAVLGKAYGSTTKKRLVGRRAKKAKGIERELLVAREVDKEDEPIQLLLVNPKFINHEVLAVPIPWAEWSRKYANYLNNYLHDQDRNLTPFLYSYKTKEALRKEEERKAASVARKAQREERETAAAVAAAEKAERIAADRQKKAQRAAAAKAKKKLAEQAAAQQQEDLEGEYEEEEEEEELDLFLLMGMVLHDIRQHILTIPPKPITRQHILTIPTKPILAVSPGWCHMQLFWNCIPRRNAMLGTLIRALREYFTQIFGKS